MYELDRVRLEGLGQRNTTSFTFRFPNGIQIKEGLSWNRSDFDTTVTSTSVRSSRFTLRATVRPAKFSPKTSTFLFDIASAPWSSLRPLDGTGGRQMRN